MTRDSGVLLSHFNLLSILRYRNFALLWSGQAVSQIGDGFFTVAVIWMVLQLTDSALAMGTTATLSLLPRLVFQLIGGVSVDRYDRRLLMLLSDVIRGGVMLVFAILVATNQLQMVHIFALAILFGIVSAFFYPAEAALIATVVPRNELVSANSLVSLTKQMAQIIAPTLAGFLIAIPTIGVAGVSFLNAISFGAGAIGVALMKLSAQETPQAQKGSFWHELGDGFHYLFRFRLLVIIFALSMVLNFALAPFQVILPIFATNFLRQGAEAFGMLLSALAVGMVVGSVAIGTWKPQMHRGVLIFVLTTVGGILLVALGMIPVFVVSLALLFVFGSLVAMANTLITAVVQGMILDAYRGRIFSLDIMLSMGLMPIALALGGGLVDAFGTSVVVTASGILVTSASLIGLLFHEIRDLD